MARAGFYAIENSTIRFGRDGRWYADGAVIENQRIAALFARHVERAEDGSFRLRIGPEQVPIVVDDTPYVVVGVTEADGDQVEITLNDGSVEPLDARKLRVGVGEVLYCRVKEGQEEARFLRPAYYQVAGRIVEAGQGGFAFRAGGITHRIERT